MAHPRPLALTLLALALAPLGACGDKGGGGGGDDTGSVDGSVDADEDGYDADADCDDADPTVNPGATEVCDEVDNNCDGFVDEGLTDTFWVDADGDGHGDAEAPVDACTAPAGAVSNSDDCDDTEARAHPAHAETCDGLDNDCDGLVDDADDDVDPATAELWFADADGDGYGDASTRVLACEPPSGTVYDDNDCDDADADQHPGADERCNGEDDDCDTTVDEPDAVDAGTWYADADGDGYGDASSSRVACEVPSGYTTDTTDCDDGDALQHPGADEVCNGEDDDCEGDVDESDAVDAGTWYADADGDGFGDPGSATVSCTAPSGTVDDDSDCDDSDALVNPDATETCNGVDDDCDPTTSEDGTVSYQDSTGLYDVTDSFTGTAGSPAWLGVSADATLWFCPGTYYAHYTVEADAVFASLSGDPADVTLDAEAGGSLFDVQTDGISLTIDGLTLVDGAGDGAVGGYSNTGGLVNCETSSTASSIVISNSDLSQGSASLGGAVAASGCDVDLDSVDIHDCVADDAGGALLVLSGDITVTDGSITDNWSEAGGAIYHYDGTTTVSDAEVSGNAATSFGAFYGYYSDLVCLGTAGGAGGFTANEDDNFGAVVIDVGSSLDATTCDLGTTAGGDDNSPVDLLTSILFEYRMGDDRSVSCDDETCGSGSTETVGSASESFSGSARLRGNVEVVSGTPTVDAFQSYLTVSPASGSTCTLYWYLLTAPDTAGPWTIEWDGSTTATAGTGWYASGDVGQALDDGQTVMFATAWSASCTVTYYRGGTSTFGFSSSHAGYGYDSAFSTTNYASATTTAPAVSAVSTPYHQKVTVTE